MELATSPKLAATSPGVEFMITRTMTQAILGAIGKFFTTKHSTSQKECWEMVHQLANQIPNEKVRQAFLKLDEYKSNEDNVPELVTKICFNAIKLHQEVPRVTSTATSSFSSTLSPATATSPKERPPVSKKRIRPLEMCSPTSAKSPIPTKKKQKSIISDFNEETMYDDVDEEVAADEGTHDKLHLKKVMCELHEAHERRVKGALELVFKHKAAQEYFKNKEKDKLMADVRRYLNNPKMLTTCPMRDISKDVPRRCAFCQHDMAEDDDVALARKCTDHPGPAIFMNRGLGSFCLQHVYHVTCATYLLYTRSNPDTRSPGCIQCFIEKNSE